MYIDCSRSGFPSLKLNSAGRMHIQSMYIQYISLYKTRVYIIIIYIMQNCTCSAIFNLQLSSHNPPVRHHTRLSGREAGWQDVWVVSALAASSWNPGLPGTTIAGQGMDSGLVMNNTESFYPSLM